MYKTSQLPFCERKFLLIVNFVSFHLNLGHLISHWYWFLVYWIYDHFALIEIQANLKQHTFIILVEIFKNLIQWHFGEFIVRRIYQLPEAFTSGLGFYECSCIQIAENGPKMFVIQFLKINPVIKMLVIFFIANLYFWNRPRQSSFKILSITCARRKNWKYKWKHLSQEMRK